MLARKTAFLFCDAWLWRGCQMLHTAKTGFRNRFNRSDKCLKSRCMNSCDAVCPHFDSADGVFFSFCCDTFANTHACNLRLSYLVTISHYCNHSAWLIIQRPSNLDELFCKCIVIDGAGSNRLVDLQIFYDFMSQSRFNETLQQSWKVNN